MGNKKDSNTPKTAKALIEQITNDEVVAAGYGPQPTSGVRAAAQHRIVELIEGSKLPSWKLKKVVSAIAPDDKHLTKMLSKSDVQDVREALATSRRELSAGVCERLFESDLETATAILESGRRVSQDAFSAMFSEGMSQARYYGDYEGTRFVNAAIRSDYPLSEHWWGYHEDRWKTTPDIYKVRGAKKSLAASGREDMPRSAVRDLLAEKRTDIDLAFAKAEHVQDRVIYDTLTRRGNPKVLKAMEKNPAFAQFRDVPVRHLALVRAS